MLAPSGGGLILYQAYGNLYAMTGFSTWMAFGGNTHDLSSFREEADEITDLHQILDEVLLTERGDGVASIKQRRRDLSSDGVWTLETASQRPFPKAQGKVKFLIVAVDYFTKFGLLGEIISDNGKQLRDNLFKDWCEELNIKQRPTPEPRHAGRKAKMERYYNTKVHITSFRPGDFVYRNNEASRVKVSKKLGPKWEGPYEVVEALGKGAYKLRNGSGDILPRTWNIQDLKKCYI
ncbi:reverse transcriptase domain-containing protein [Tanacetum coccineum]